MKEKDNIVFDIGGVLIGWEPRLIYKDMFANEDELTWFFQNVCTPEWNRKQDAGRTFKEATEELLDKFPEFEEPIRAYYDRWPEMITGEIPKSVETLRHLKSLDYELYALTNWSAESFSVVRTTYNFFDLFDGIVVSAHEKETKPDPEIYQILFSRYGLQPTDCVFIDDTKANVDTALTLGMKAIHFNSPEQMKADLKKHCIM